MAYVFVIGTIDRFSFLGEHHRHVIETAQHGCDGYTTGLYGQYLVHLCIVETTLQFTCYLPNDVDINLMVQEIINLQYIALFDNSVFKYFFFEEIHISR